MSCPSNSNTLSRRKRLSPFVVPTGARRSPRLYGCTLASSRSLNVSLGLAEASSVTISRHTMLLLNITELFGCGLCDCRRATFGNGENV